MAIINGRRVTNIPNSGVYGSEILKEMNVQSGRRGVFMEPGSFKPIEPRRLYTKDQVLDRKGRSIKVTDIPDRTKGSSDLFSGQRSSFSKAIITEQVYDIAEKLYTNGLEFDEDDANWVVIPSFKLPEIWHHIAKFTPLLIVFPTLYPEIPPVGCYVRETIRQSVDGHLFANAYHQAATAPLTEGWKWYCVYVQPGTWRPSAVRKPGEWRHGDNLWTYITLINEALAQPT